jgi:two-component system chemotaxis sensor kinase CheA
MPNSCLKEIAMQLDEIEGIFFLECDEGLVAVETYLAAHDRDPSDPEAVNTIFRAVHSIKGGAGAFGHERLQAFTHHFETVLDGLRTGQLTSTPALRTLLFAAFDLLTDHVAAAKRECDTPDDAGVLARLTAVAEGRGDEAGGDPAAPPADTEEFGVFDDMDFDSLLADITAPSAWRVDYIPGPQAFDNGGEPLLLIGELAGIGGTLVSADFDRLPMLGELAPETSYCGWTFSVPHEVSEDDIRGIFDFLSPECTVGVVRADQYVAPEAPEAIEPVVAPAPAPVAAAPAQPAPTPAPAAAKPAAPAPAKAPAPAPAKPKAGKDAPAEDGDATPRNIVAASTIRVELDKLDRLINLVGELVITQAMLSQRLSLNGLAAIDELGDLAHLTGELQDSAMSIRAQPVKSVFNRVPRIIRELEADTGKRVKLEVEGEMTEVDKTVVERIGEPLTHMIRNAVDHGLEMPDERVALGKPAEGTVRLAAEHRGGRIVISVSDDGRGIDTARVRAKAIERGIISPDQSLSEEEIENLIFAPGFSTATTVSNISGRGVGMDVVRKNVQALGGRIGITSKHGQGSTFRLTLPLTLAILDGMIVSVGEQTYVIPLTHIVESLRPDPKDLRSMGPGASVLDVRGSYLPIQQVGRMLRVPGARTEPTEAVLVVVESDAGRAILMVDDIQDQRQVVVKSLETNFSVVDGLAGATILGDGRVALILDVDSIIARHRDHHDHASMGMAA